MAEKKKSGFVAIIGKPNVGKSTLLNRLVGTKIAGVSPKPQTTRGVVRGILTQPEGQILFLDTPGVHNSKDLLGDWMIREVEKTLEEADLIYWIVLPEPDRPFEEKILKAIEKIKIPVFLLVNKIDHYKKISVIPVLDDYQKLYPFAEFIPISAKRGDQVDLLIQKTFEHLPEGPMHFPEDQVSDQNERDLVGEIIREKLYHCTGEEIPYSAAVMIDKFSDREDGLTEIHATIVVEKDSQKAIVIGAGGVKAKEIGQDARRDIEELLGRKVFLKLWVKTQLHWKRDKAALRDLGYQ